MKNAKALEVRASRRGNNGGDGSQRSPPPGQSRGQQVAVCAALERECPHGVVVRERAHHDASPRTQQLSGRLIPLVVRAVRLHAKPPGLPESMFTLRAGHASECAHCDYLISWHRAPRLRRRFQKAGGFLALITLPTLFAPVRCGWCWGMI